MSKILSFMALIAALALPALCQYGQRLSRNDQKEFDQIYSKWLNDSRRHDRDDVANDARRMQDIMARNNVPADVPFDQIATNGRYEGNNVQQAYPGYVAGRLSSDDQHEFDKIYAKWIHDNQKGDRDDVAKDAHRMQDIMARYNIPSDVPFNQIASPNAGYHH